MDRILRSATFLVRCFEGQQSEENANNGSCTAVKANNYGGYRCRGGNKSGKRVVGPKAVGYKVLGWRSDVRKERKQRKERLET